MTVDSLLARARALDSADPLAQYRDRFIGHDDPELPAYLDGNSLGRPLQSTLERYNSFITTQWGGRLIRGWDDGWLQLPLTLGDRIGEVALGAANGQCIVADSTTVLLYKLARAAVVARPGRTEIVLDRDNFPTDRYIMEGIADECGLHLKWVQPSHDGGVTADDVRDVVGPETAFVVLSHVAYRSGYLSDMESITSSVHDAGALVLWDLCHSVGSVPVQLDACGVDYAVGCSYKYLNGGPGAPAWAYVAERHQAQLNQPIQGWIGSADPFRMVQGYEPAPGIRRMLSGTPPIMGMLAIEDMVDLIGTVGIDEVRKKSVALTEFALESVGVLLAPHNVQVASPVDAARRGSHVTIDHPSFREVTAQLWEKGIIPDYRNPDGIRLGLSPLSTSFRETLHGIVAIEEILAAG